MSTNYTEITKQVGDAWTAAFAQVSDTITSSIADATSSLDLPKLGLGEFADQFGSITSTLPQPQEIVSANFALLERLVGAQRDLALKLVAAVPAVPAPAAKR